MEPFLQGILDNLEEIMVVVRDTQHIGLIERVGAPVSEIALDIVILAQNSGLDVHTSLPID